MNIYFNRKRLYPWHNTAFIIVLTLLAQLVSISAFAQHWSHATLEEKKGAMMTAVNGNKIYFYSGVKMVGSSITRVDQLEIFNVLSDTKEVLALPNGAESYEGATAVLRSQVFFGGGSTNGGVTSRVNIYDTITDTWSTTYLSLDRYFLAATAANGKVFFGGGSSFSTNKVTKVMDIYTASAGTWTSTLFPSFGGRDMTAISIGNKVLFAGGQITGNNSIDNVYCYNTETNQWLTTAKLSQPKSKLSSQVYQNKVYFIGGTSWNPLTNAVYPSDTIDVYDNASNSWSTMKIPRLITSITGIKRPYIKSAVAGCKLFMLPGSDYANVSADTIAVYDFARETWSYQTLPHPKIQSSIAACGNKVYFAGGSDITNANFVNGIDILTLEPKLQLAIDNTALTAYNLGTILPGDEMSTSIALSNEGDYDLLFKDLTSRITVSGDVDDFTVDASAVQTTDTLEPARIISLPISFHPATLGTKQLTITIQSNDPQAPVYTFQLTGTAEDTPTSIASAVTNKISVYPNPTSGMIHIDAGKEDNLDVQVVNFQGIVMKEQHLQQSNMDLDLSTLPEGLYVVKIKGDKASSAVKVMKR